MAPSVQAAHTERYQQNNLSKESSRKGLSVETWESEIPVLPTLGQQGIRWLKRNEHHSSFILFEFCIQSKHCLGNVTELFNEKIIPPHPDSHI